MPDTTTSAAETRGSSLWSRNFLLATIGNLFFFTSVTTFFVLPVQLEELGASRAEVGRIIGTFGVASVIAIPVTGTLVDRFGRRRFMLAGGLLWSIAAVAFSRVSGLGPPLYALRLVQGLAFSLAFIATNALVVDLAPAGALGRALSVFGTTTLATHAVGPSLGEVIAAEFGFGVLYAGSSLMALLAMTAFAAIREPPASLPASSAMPSSGMLSLATRAGNRSALVAGVTSALAFGTAMHFMPIFVRSRGLSSHAPFFTAYVAAAVGVRLVAGGLGDRLGHRRVGGTALLLFGMVVGAFGLVRAQPLLIALAFAFGASHGWAYPALNALFVESAPGGSRGRAMALFNLSFNIGITLAAFIGGEIAARLGYGPMWLIVASLCLIGVGALVWDSRTSMRP